MRRLAVVALLVVLQGRVAAQAPAGEEPASRDGESRCEGCPTRRPWIAAGEAGGIILFYNLVNRILPTEFSDDFDVSPKTWVRNIGHGFSWDNDAFLINQFGHPYQGGNFWCAGRANGLEYWESLPFTAAASVLWEWVGERSHPAWNDVVNTTVGGAAFGEVLHRLSWLVRDPSGHGRGRFWRELAATAIEPIGGLNRLASGAARRPGDTPRSLRQARAAVEVQFGARWSAPAASLPAGASAKAFGSFAVEYGTLVRGSAGKPFDAFTMDARVGGGSLLSAASVRGRLASWTPGGSEATRLLLLQGYGLRQTANLRFGEQSLLVALSRRREIRPGVSVGAHALVGAVLLGSIDSLHAENPDRSFDYGPGTSLHGQLDLSVGRVPVVRVTAAGWWLHTVTREPANHRLSTLRFEGRVPVTAAFHLLVDAERLARNSFVHGSMVRADSYPELRAGVAWRIGR